MRIAINGFGRIGRICFRTLLEKKDLEVVAINDVTDPATLAHLLKYDSVHGKIPAQISAEGQQLLVNGREIPVYSEKDPAKLPWNKLDIDLVIESTGKFITKDLASLHLRAGAKQVIISAPSPDKEVPTVVLGVNDHKIDLSASLLSNASCTTNNVAPLVKILDDNWGDCRRIYHNGSLYDRRSKSA